MDPDPLALAGRACGARGRVVVWFDEVAISQAALAYCGYGTGRLKDIRSNSGRFDIDGLVEPESFPVQGRGRQGVSGFSV